MVVGAVEYTVDDVLKVAEVEAEARFPRVLDLGGRGDLGGQRGGEERLPGILLLISKMRFSRREPAGELAPDLPSYVIHTKSPPNFDIVPLWLSHCPHNVCSCFSISESPTYQDMDVRKKYTSRKYGSFSNCLKPPGSCGPRTFYALSSFVRRRMWAISRWRCVRSPWRQGRTALGSPTQMAKRGLQSWVSRAAGNSMENWNINFSLTPCSYPFRQERMVPVKDFHIVCSSCNSLVEPPRGATLEVVAFRGGRRFAFPAIATMLALGGRLRRRRVNGLDEGRGRVGKVGLVRGGESTVVILVSARLHAIFVVPVAFRLAVAVKVRI